MRTLFPILALAILFAYLTEVTTVKHNGKIGRQSATNNLFYILLILTLSIPIGLRTYYNDTFAYITNFQNSLTIGELFTSGSLDLLKNPASVIYTSLIYTLTGNYHVYFMLAAIFVQYAYVSTIRRYSYSFPLGIVIYFCLGTYVFSVAALKQTIAMGILMLSIPRLLDGKYVKFYLMVFLAFLFHTYALAFAVAPLLQKKLWSGWTYGILLVTILVMLNFESVIGSFLDYANEQGKKVAEYEVFDNNTVNLFRVTVYAVVPVMSFAFRRYLKGSDETSRYCNLFFHMAVISFAFMLLGTINGANMFARMAFYFEFGIIIGLPWIIFDTFEKKSAQYVTTLAVVCFLAFFFYANAIVIDFDSAYYAISIGEFLRSLLNI